MMSFERPIIESRPEEEPKAKIEIESGYEQFVPAEFRDDPIGYFEKEGRNVKSGEIKYDEAGKIREDPTAVKDLPPWFDQDSNRLDVVVRRVNVAKGEVGESGDPFYEYKILELARELGLPAARPVAKVESGGNHLIVMEKISGVRWSEKDALHLREKGYSDEDIEDLRRQAEKQMAELQQWFNEAGILKDWKLKDMVFNIDVKGKKIRKIIPTDWERTKIDRKKVKEYRRKLQK